MYWSLNDDNLPVTSNTEGNLSMSMLTYRHENAVIFSTKYTKIEIPSLKQTAMDEEGNFITA